MARGKKTKEELTPEEKLAQAFVPVEEQPYPVPENWCWVYGESLFLPMESQKPTGEIFRYIDIDSIDNKLQVVSEPKVLPVDKAPSRANRALHIGDTVFSMVRPYLKNIAYIDESISDAIASTGFYVCQPRGNINHRFVYYLMISPYVVDGLNSFMKGDNSPSIRKDDLERFVYPVPPYSEQQRIVDCIESLFAKLDEAKEKAQAVVDGFETRKAAILHKAFTGELTAQWRQTNKLRLEDWEQVTVGDIASLITKGASPRWQGVSYTEDINQTLFVTSENVREGYLSFEKEKYIDNKINEIQKRSILNYGDVLVNIVGASIGRVAVFNRNQLANVNQAVCIIRLKDGINNQFICLYLNSPSAQMYFSDSKVETARANISLSDIKAMQIKLPKLDEQLAILQILQELFAKEQQAKESAEAVIDQIDTMKKSILARAFRGELGTNDPAEESSIELLKTVI